MSLFDWQLIHRADGHPEIAYQSVMNTIYPAMHRQWLPPIPRILNDRRLTDIRNRLDNIQLTQTIIFHPWRKRIPEILFMLLMDILNMMQPVIRQTDPLFHHGNVNTRTVIMSGDHNMTNPDNIHSKLHDSQTTQISIRNDIGDISVHENITRQQIGNLCRRNTAIGTTDPEILGQLLRYQP